MGRTFTWHAGLALGFGAVLIALGLWGPRAGWLVVAGFAVALPVSAAAVLRGVWSGVDRATLWASFRCLPKAVRVGCAGLVLAGVLVTAPGFVNLGDLSDAQEGPGGYSALDTRTKERVRISRERYEEVRVAEQRGFLAVPGTLLAVSGTLVLALGEWNGVGPAGRTSGVGRTRAAENGRSAT
ncbi:hypothetical protein [Streptomyces sp. SID11385]|uniref:hypothetical protein n=1 Tax=Streptomyces sp. SID11385 TaxID=2706031 RepID=UPI0013C9B18D|nr:hypothetical protein [Streptomyces sp. SID11385]NEA38505.1 hypothetical protein [Streptomyces sp. SID11385]